MFGFLVAEVRTVAELADTPWAAERGVFTEVEPGARVAGGTVPVRPVADRRARPCATTRATHPRGAAGTPRLDDDALDLLEAGA